MANDLYSTRELLAERTQYEWVLENLLPAGGRLLFHGREGIGKTLMAMALAIAILNRGRLFGEWQARRPKNHGILYVQADLPKILHRDRMVRFLKSFPWMEEQPLYHYCPDFCDVMALDEDTELNDRMQEIQPWFIVWDVLRSVEHMREEEHVPGLVYGQMHRLFPRAGHFIIHHDRKVTRDSAEGFLDPREAFSGMKTWINLVISAWHLEEDGKHHLKLVTTKNNCGPIPEPMLLQRDPVTLLPVCRVPRVTEETLKWKTLHNAQDRPLSPKEQETLRRYLLASFVAPTTVVERMTQTVNDTKRKS